MFTVNGFIVYLIYMKRNIFGIATQQLDLRQLHL